MRTTRYALVFWMVAVSTAAWALLLQVAGGASPSPQERLRRSAPEVKITGFHLVESKDGAKLWEVWGDVAEVFEK